MLDEKHEKNKKQALDSQKAKFERMLSEGDESFSTEEKEKFAATHQMVVESTICNIELESELQKQELQSKIARQKTVKDEHLKKSHRLTLVKKLLLAQKERNRFLYNYLKEDVLDSIKQMAEVKFKDLLAWPLLSHWRIYSPDFGESGQLSNLPN
ncbi:uncharacterized protein LOC135488588 [Lineus longissimus]|uniref:uncharacterized protein LOC135488588 n=1 Tax=Lineus longissimus TaxID=88925 RepID=UPI002B4D977A